MWYPGKFWRNLSYSCIDGRLRDELGVGGRPGWKHRRRWRIAVRHDADFGVAVLDGWGPAHVDGWEDTVDHRFDSVTLRFERSAGGHVAWVRTAAHHRPYRMLCQPVAGSVDDPTTVEVPTHSRPIVVDLRSGAMSATCAQVDGRFAEVLQPIGGEVDASRLRLAPLASVVG